MIVCEYIFWIALFLIFWTYVGYYGFLWLLSRFCRKKSFDDMYRPKVSLLITAYNEEKNIGRKIENCLEIRYPSDLFEIIIVFYMKIY